MRGSLPADSLSKNHGLESNLRMNIYVGNLAYSITDDDLREAFAAFGEVSRASVIMDRDTGRSKGFGFVEMPDDNEARTAISELDGKDIEGRAIKVNEARPRTDRRGGGGAPRWSRYRRSAGAEGDGDLRRVGWTGSRARTGGEVVESPL